MSSFDEYYRENKQLVYSLCTFYLRNNADAEDVTQEVFLKFIEKSPRFKSPTHAKAWFLQCAKNACITKLRQNARRKTGSVDDMDTFPLTNPISDYVPDELDELPEKYRELLYLRYVDDLPEKIIAQTLHRKESTVRGQIARGKKLLVEIYNRKREKKS